MTIGDHRSERVGIGIDVLQGHDHVDAVRLAVDVIVDPSELLFELLGPKASRTEDPEAAGAAHFHHDVPAVGESKDRHLDSQALAQLGLHSMDS